MASVTSFARDQVRAAHSLDLASFESRRDVQEALFKLLPVRWGKRAVAWLVGSRAMVYPHVRLWCTASERGHRTVRGPEPGGRRQRQVRAQRRRRRASCRHPCADVGVARWCGVVGASARYRLAWRMNLDVFQAKLGEIADFVPPPPAPLDTRATFIGGGRSTYLAPQHHDTVRKFFGNADIHMIQGASA